jgi:hypothetical protein
MRPSTRLAACTVCEGCVGDAVDLRDAVDVFKADDARDIIDADDVFSAIDIVDANASAPEALNGAQAAH